LLKIKRIKNLSTCNIILLIIHHDDTRMGSTYVHLQSYTFNNWSSRQKGRTSSLNLCNIISLIIYHEYKKGWIFIYYIYSCTYIFHCIQNGHKRDEYVPYIYNVFHLLKSTCDVIYCLNSPLFSRNGELWTMWTGAELLFSLYFR
jgi:hypothetical protein